MHGDPGKPGRRLKAARLEEDTVSLSQNPAFETVRQLSVAEGSGNGIKTHGDRDTLK
jgi:hypothetical protein